LRCITLAGVDSVNRTIEDRTTAWQRLSDLLDPSVFDDISTTIALEDAITVADDLISGKVRGRVVVEIK
jgi:acrylyl-CoA reductase (NADPH)